MSDSEPFWSKRETHNQLEEAPSDDSEQAHHGGARLGVTFCLSHSRGAGGFFSLSSHVSPALARSGLVLPAWGHPAPS